MSSKDAKAEWEAAKAKADSAAKKDGSSKARRRSGTKVARRPGRPLAACGCCLGAAWVLFSSTHAASVHQHSLRCGVLACCFQGCMEMHGCFSYILRIWRLHRANRCAPTPYAAAAPATAEA